jgi:hypothetical protein
LRYFVLNSSDETAAFTSRTISLLEIGHYPLVKDLKPCVLYRFRFVEIVDNITLPPPPQKKKIIKSDWILLRRIKRRNANKLLVILQWHILFCFAEFGKENNILRSALDYLQFVRKT